MVPKPSPPLITKYDLLGTRALVLALLVTCSEHTRLVSPGKLQAFDPLRGFVDDMPARRGDPYAGLLLASST